MTMNWIKEYRDDIPSAFADENAQGYIYHFGTVDTGWFENNLHIYKNRNLPNSQIECEFFVDIDGDYYESNNIAELEAILWDWAQNTK
jgi:hypothetical protein